MVSLERFHITFRIFIFFGGNDYFCCRCFRAFPINLATFMQGKNFSSAVHLRKARSLANANNFVAFGG